MIYDYKTLENNELTLFKAALDKYNDYDKLDLVIELIFDKKIKEKIKSRGIKKIKRKEEKSSEAIPEGLKYCDGEHCVVSII